MKRLLILLFFSVFANESTFAQSIYTPCKDPLKVENITYYCYEDYAPVCGCDGITYRNYCVAENQYALNRGNYTFGPCTGFDYDLSPNQVVDFLRFKIYKKKPGFFTVTIYDIFGQISFTRVYTYNDVTSIYLSHEISVGGFEQGLYIMEIISDNEQQIKKFFKVNLN
jgi:Kazal-type serine protease inhibitor domain